MPVFKLIAADFLAELYVLAIFDFNLLRFEFIFWIQVLVFLFLGGQRRKSFNNKNTNESKQIGVR